MDEKEVTRYLNVIRRAVGYIEGMLGDGDLVVKRHLCAMKKLSVMVEQMLQDDESRLLEKLLNEDDGSPVVVQQVAKPQVPAPVVVSTLPKTIVVPTVEAPPTTEVETAVVPVEEDWKTLRKKHIKDLLEIHAWPEAIAAYLVPPPRKDEQLDRANSILDSYVGKPMEGLHFLDYGCGEGWLSKAALGRGAVSSTGYDIVDNPTWKELQGPIFTTDFDQLKRYHYDVIFLFDVLDHVKDPVELMVRVRTLLKSTGKVFIRCHPWTSKHATHAFRNGLNKAWIHLFLKPEEIKELTKTEPMFTRPEKNPLEAYQWWFHEFDIERSHPKHEAVHPLFHNPAFKQLLATEQELPLDQIDTFLKAMEIQNVDYVLKVKPEAVA